MKSAPKHIIVGNDVFLLPPADNYRLEAEALVQRFLQPLCLQNSPNPNLQFKRKDRKVWYESVSIDLYAGAEPGFIVALRKELQYAHLTLTHILQITAEISYQIQRERIRIPAASL